MGRMTDIFEYHPGLMANGYEGAPKTLIIIIKNALNLKLLVCGGYVQRLRATFSSQFSAVFRQDDSHSNQRQNEFRSGVD